MSKNWFISIFFIALLFLIIHQLFLVFSPFLHPILWAAFLTFLVYPVYRMMASRFKKYETWIAILTTGCLLLIVTPILVVVVFQMSSQVLEFFQRVVAYVKEGHLEALLTQFRALPFIRNIESEILKTEILEQGLSDWILRSTRAVGNFTVEQVGIITKNLVYFGLGFLLAFFLVFAFLRDGEKIYQFVYQIAPMDEKHKKVVFAQITGTFAAVIRGQLLTSFVQALIAATVFQVLGLPTPLFWGAVTFISALIPVMGASLVWVSFVIYLVIIQSYIKAVILFLLGTFLISLIDNFLKPALIGKRTKLPYFLLFLGILGGLKLYGLSGIFLAPILLSLFFALIQIYREEYL